VKTAVHLSWLSLAVLSISTRYLYIKTPPKAGHAASQPSFQSAKEFYHLHIGVRQPLLDSWKRGAQPPLQTQWGVQNPKAQQSVEFSLVLLPLDRSWRMDEQYRV
jgi:hypothetical protein